MKLAYSTLGCPEWTLEEAIAAARENHIAALEIRGLAGEMDLLKIPALSPENMAETRAKLGELAICTLGSSLKFDRSADREEMLCEGKKLVDLASADGIPYIRIFGNDIFPDEDEAAAIAHLAGGVAALSSYAEGKNVMILLEVHGTINTLERLKGISDLVPSPTFGILWDIAHTDKKYKDNFRDFYLPLLPRIRHIHVKDHLRLEEGTKLVGIGDGEIPIAAIVKSLLADGYDGYFSLEWEKKWHPDLADLEEALPVYAKYMQEAAL